ncbi:hypothetical protein F5Y12DRAFT_706328 [Xylaria sp. FL1777]|nr:hypothetical protein F5Y12DRAFT_706328 [Xylaria sp. FL1777]
MSVPWVVAAKTTPTLSRRLGCQHLQAACFPRSIGTTTTTSSAETPQPPSPPSPSSSQTHPGPRRHKIPEPQLCPVDAYKAAPHKLVIQYTEKLNRGSPLLIKNLPGLLDGQTWIGQTSDREGSFRVPEVRPRKHTAPGFGPLHDIFESAATGRSQTNSDASPEPANFRAPFDDLEARCTIARASLEGDHPPLLRFRDWLPQSSFRDDFLDEVIAEIQETFSASSEPHIPFKAPLVFIRAAHQYNQDQKAVAETAPSLKDNPFQDPDYSACLSRLKGLVILEEKMTDEFPFPNFIRDIGLSTYKTKACTVRTGIRPLRSELRRHQASTVMVGQLAGYSIATLVSPHARLPNGMPLMFNRDIPSPWQGTPQRYPVSLPNKWTREWEHEFAASGNVVFATLTPGAGLLVPKGWWYTVRSINNGLELYATVTWFLTNKRRVGEKQEDHIARLKRLPPWVRI